jgi:hypothetical protein
MRKIIRTILRVLDGAPPPDTSKQRGQSLVEMAFITPLLIIMFLGIVEIGWYANHFLILLEVTRVGARSGTVLTGDLSPLAWTEAATTHPIVYERDAGLTWTSLDEALPQPPPAQSATFRSCAPGTDFGFYNFIACSMLDSLEPLTVKGRDPATTDVVERTVRNRSGDPVATIPIPDDIIISVFSLAAINNQDPATLDPLDYPDAERYADVYSRTFDFDAVAPDVYEPGFQLVVTGRYPESANECNVYYDVAPPSGPQNIWYNDVRDPFDFIPDGVRNQANVGGRQLFIEQEGYDEGPEMQRGFAWTGQHQVLGEFDADGREILCWGSEFTAQDVADLMNSPSFIGEADLPPEPQPGDYGDPIAYQADHDAWEATVADILEAHGERVSFLPSQGLVLVEMYWMHDLLLDFPFLSPILQMFGDPNNIVINVWAAFPVPAVEPSVVFDLP